MTAAPGALLVAFHFPPLKGSSGLERTLGFARGLGPLGWEVAVLSAHPRAYAAVSDERLGDVPAAVPVLRPFALDARRHLSVGPFYPRLLARPDRWSTWIPGAVAAGYRHVRRGGVDVIWSTYPIASAHVIGYWLHRLTGRPWVADFRDPMVEYDARTGTHYPTDAAERRARLRVERLCARHAAALVFCTAGAQRIFAERYPEVPRERLHLVPNGFDEGAFSGLPPPGPATAPGGPVTLIHSGILYPGPDRDPVAFLTAVRQLLAEDPGWQARLKVILRASGYEAQYGRAITDLGLEKNVQLAPATPYRDALAEMQRADGLLVFQGHASNPAIPAKVYEYFRAGRPVFALVDAAGDTAALLRAENVGTLVPIDDPPAILAGLRGFLAGLESGAVRGMAPAVAARFERGARARELHQILAAARALA